jgi:hypothetical protein
MKIIIKTIHEIYTINILEPSISINNLITNIAIKEYTIKENISILYKNEIIKYSDENNQKFISDDCYLFVIIKNI